MLLCTVPNMVLAPAPGSMSHFEGNAVTHLVISSEYLHFLNLPQGCALSFPPLPPPHTYK